MKYKNITVTKKTGRGGDYTYYGYFDVTEKKGWFSTYDYRVHFDGRAMNYVDTDKAIEGDYDCWDGRVLGKIIELGQNIKSEDECCISPDLVAGVTYNKYDIILCYLTWHKDIKVIDYCFKKDDSTESERAKKGVWGAWYTLADHLGYIKFLYKDQEYCYNIWRSDEVSEYGCLNCGTCDKSEEKGAIQDFKVWLSGEVKAQERKDKAQQICGCEDEVYDD